MEMLRAKRKAWHLAAEDFGASPTNADNTAALNAAFRAVRERKAAKLTLGKGVYRLTSDAALNFGGLSDFVFDGNGSTFVCRRKSNVFMHVEACHRVELKNFQVDWDWAKDPLASLVRVVSVGKGECELLFVDYADFPRKDAGFVMLSAFDPKTRSVGFEGGLTRSLSRLGGAERRPAARHHLHGRPPAHGAEPRVLQARLLRVLAWRGRRLQHARLLGLVKADAAGHYDITFAEDLPEVKKDGFVLFDRTYDTRNIIVKNSYFHDNRARGLLILARDVTVEDNVFRHHEMGAIKIETGYTFDVWSEGYGVTNVVIRNNLFDNVNPSCSNDLHGRRVIYSGIYLRHDPSSDTTDYPIISDILIAGNTFRDQSGVTAWLSSTANVTFRDNVIADPYPRHDELSSRSQVKLINVRHARIERNDWMPSDYVAAPGVSYDPENCADVIVK